MLRGSVVARTAETLTLSSGVTLAAYPCRPSAVRGLRARVVVVDELAFFRNSEGMPTDVEMLRALRPTTAMTGGRIIILSSPYAQAGALYDLQRRYFGRDDAPTLIWQASAPEMNPLLPADYLQRMEQDDPEAYRSEVLGEFRAGLTILLDPEALAACVDSGVRERPRIGGTRGKWFADTASGTGSDSFAVARSRPDGNHAIHDVLRVWKPPFNPANVIAEASALIRSYGETALHGDRYAGGFVTEGFAAHNIRYTPSELDRSQIYLELLPLINAGRARLLDLPDLLRELRGLERRRGSSGRDRVDHRAGGHDDQANAVAGSLVLAASKGTGPVGQLTEVGVRGSYWRGSGSLSGFGDSRW